MSNATPAGDVGRLRRGLANIVAPAALLILLFAAWEVAVVEAGVPAFILPRPSAILVEVFTDWELYQGNLIFTLKNVLIGFAVAFVVAMVLGFIVAHSKIANRALYPILVASQTVPVIAIAPIFIIWFGYGIMPKIVTTALICFFPLTVNTIAGYLSVDPDQRTLFKAYNAGPWNTFRKLTFPAALPYIMSGLKITVTLSVIGGVIGEWIGSEQGLGYLIIQSSAQIMTVRVFAAVALLAAMGIVLFIIASIIERLAMPWKLVG
jgi:ABC-type nitrate/sulfonate/bicarbonate transport system permease component